MRRSCCCAGVHNLYRCRFTGRIRTGGSSLNASTPAFPENGYGIAKLCTGQMTKVLCEQKGIRHIWTRILSIYGPFDGAKTMVMSTIVSLLKGGRPQCTAGEQMWDYLYSADAGYAMYLLGEKGVSGKTYCIGGGTARPLRGIHRSNP